MQCRRSIGVGILLGGLSLIGAVLGAVVWRHAEWLGLRSGSDLQSIWLLVIGVVTLVGLISVAGYHVFWPRQGRSAYPRLQADDWRKPVQADAAESPETQIKQQIVSIRTHLHQHYGIFWRFKIRLLLVIGEPVEIDAIAPGLAEQHWLEGQGTVLLWGGSLQASLDVARWHGLSRWRALDAVVWALSKTQSADGVLMEAGARQLQRLARTVRWQLPLYLWQVCDSKWPQPGRVIQPVGCLLPTHVTAEVLETRLHHLLEPLRREGFVQMNATMIHDFLLRLSRDLQVEGIARWRQALAPLFGPHARGVPLRGLWFSLPVLRAGEGRTHQWPVTPEWQGVIADKAAKGNRLGWSLPRVAPMLILGLTLLWGAGLLLSFVSNRTQIAQAHTVLAVLQQPGSQDDLLRALSELVRELSRLDYRVEHPAPWYQRFGLNQNPALLNALWPRYIEANNRLLRDPAAAHLQRQLTAFSALPAGSPQRAEQADEAYEHLKAYLMMATPQKVDAAYLASALGHAAPLRAGLSPGLWQGLSPGLWQFYAEQLAVHPAWGIQSDPGLIVQVRHILLRQLGRRNAEASLYQDILDAAAMDYPEFSLQDTVGATDATALFSTHASVPGVFTRQVWDSYVRQAIDDVAEARREEIDWVLSDKPADIDPALTPDVLKQRLTERYFQDYSSAWLAFLNSLRWRQAGSLSEVIDQLTLLGDARQSPLIALLNTLVYQGQAGTRRQALADSLLASAQKLIATDKHDNVAQIETIESESSSPLDATFGPLLALLGKDPQGNASSNGNDTLSLQAFLNRVTRVRLKLQQISSAPDPQEMIQALAQTVFQGKSIDLTDTRSYGSLMAASLGAQWSIVGQTLFVQPLAQAWERVLQPSAAGLNSQWQRAIVSPWQQAFASRYPFAATTSDASLPMLGQMIRADSGRIEQFLQRELSGVVRKEGNRWVADPRHSQGLRLNPYFLTAINQLSELADVIYTDGGMGASFELRAKPVRDIVQTTFILNGQKHQYFNQKESWQRFNWPGRSDYPGVSLSWISVRAGERLFGDYQGTWGLIRLLEHARLTPLDDGASHYRMVIKAPDGLELTWHLRTELHAGPLALLKLRGFTLPTQIFLGTGTGTAGYAQNGTPQ